MNKTFKTIWNDARRCFIVANETQKSHGKPSKSAVALAVAATALFSTVASAAYIEKGFVAQNSEQVAEAQKSWQSDEYKKDWGLEAMHASKAYACRLQRSRRSDRHDGFRRVTTEASRVIG